MRWCSAGASYKRNRVGQGHTAHAVGAGVCVGGGGYLDIFSPLSFLFSFSFSLVDDLI